MMKTILLDHIPFRADTDLLAKKLHLTERPRYVEQLEQLVQEAEALARPKAIYGVAYIEEKGDDFVVAEGIRLTSRILRVNLEEAHRLFPFVATCGVELDEWGQSMSNTLHRYWAEAIEDMALRVALRSMKEALVEHFHPGETSDMHPGSLADWPIEEQRPLFELLGDVEELAGVRLLDSLLMSPTKSVSGVRFPTEESFESCQLCPREECPGRQAPYDQGLYDRKYRLKTSAIPATSEER